MRLFIVAAICVVLGATTALAQTTKVSFSHLSTVTANGDLSACEANYGDGYTTRTDASKGSRQYKLSDKGHSIHITKSSITLREGIYVLTNEYELTFPNGTDAEPSNVFVYATAANRGGPYVGVFSDGTCKGNVKIAPQG